MRNDFRMRLIYEEDDEMKWNFSDIKTLPYYKRVENADEEIFKIEPERFDPLDFRWKFTSMQQEFLTRKQTYALAGEEKLNASSLMQNLLRHDSSKKDSLAHLSIEQEAEIKRLQEPLVTIPEQSEILGLDVVHPETVEIQQPEEELSKIPHDIPTNNPFKELGVDAIHPQVVEQEQPGFTEEDRPQQELLPEEERARQELLPEEERLQQELLPEEKRSQELVSEKDLPTAYSSPRTKLEEVRSTVLGKLKSLWLEGNGVTTFNLLCPPGSVAKPKAACYFNILLHLKQEQVLDLQQEDAYGTIEIIRKDI